MYIVDMRISIMRICECVRMMRMDAVRMVRMGFSYSRHSHPIRGFALCACRLSWLRIHQLRVQGIEVDEDAQRHDECDRQPDHHPAPHRAEKEPRGGIFFISFFALFSIVSWWRANSRNRAASAPPHSGTPPATPSMSARRPMFSIVLRPECQPSRGNPVPGPCEL